nr:MAG TPA: hypothetical protein [Caudoviricetes sp.]
MAFSKRPEVTVKMTVHDLAELLTAYAPVGVSVWYSPGRKELVAGLRDTDERDIAIDTGDTVDLNETLNVLFNLPYTKRTVS